MNRKNVTMFIMALIFVLMFTMMIGCRRSEDDLSDQEPESGDVVEEVDETPETSESEGSEGDIEDQYYVLYLKHKDQAFIFSDTYRIKANDPKLEGKSMAEYVIEELINQKGIGELINPIHPDTEILSLEQDGRKVTLNLSEEFTENLTGTVEHTEATIAMVVNTLITLPSIDQVSLLIEGEKPDTINGLEIQDVYGFITEYYPDK